MRNGFGDEELCTRLREVNYPWESLGILGPVLLIASISLSPVVN
jgi:hypothetical protein